MQFIRCRICGETYLGSETPSRCPFCGAGREHMTGPDGFSTGEDDVALTEVERGDLDRAIELERSNARFYTAVAMLPGDEDLASAFKRLAAVEAEHCSLFCRLAGEVKPLDLRDPEGSPQSWSDAVAESADRERRAADFYALAAGNATNERVREVFRAVQAVELDHIALDALAAARARSRAE